MGFHRKVFKGFSGGGFTGGRSREPGFEDSGRTIMEEARWRAEVNRKLEEYKEQVESERKEFLPGGKK